MKPLITAVFILAPTANSAMGLPNQLISHCFPAEADPPPQRINESNR